MEITPLAIILMITLAVIFIGGTILKIKLLGRVNELDGLGGTFIKKEEQQSGSIVSKGMVDGE